MPSAFAARDAKLSGAIDRAFGETVTFSARQVAASGDVNLPTRADGSKPSFSVKGAWEALPIANYPLTRGSNPDDAAQRVSMQYPCVSVDDTLLQWRPAKGDLCTRGLDGTKYEVLRAMPDDMGRTLFILTNKKDAA